MPTLGEVMNVAEQDIAMAELRAASPQKRQKNIVKQMDRYDDQANPTLATFKTVARLNS